MAQEYDKKLLEVSPRVADMLIELDKRVSKLEEKPTIAEPEPEPIEPPAPKDN